MISENFSFLMTILWYYFLSSKYLLQSSSNEFLSDWFSLPNFSSYSSVFSSNVWIYASRSLRILCFSNLFEIKNRLNELLLFRCIIHVSGSSAIYRIRSIARFPKILAFDFQISDFSPIGHLL